jgi:hypothetical protein
LIACQDFINPFLIISPKTKSMEKGAYLAELTVNNVAAIPAAHVKIPLTTPQGPLLEVSVKPSSLTEAAVYVAHVPVVYQVPALIKHPLFKPLVYACKKPLPTNGTAVEVGMLVPVLIPVLVGDAVWYFGTYLTPVAAQLDFEPSGDVGTKVPVWILPRTL